MAFCKPFCFITSLFKHFLCNNSYNKNTWISDLLSEHFFQIRIQTFQKENKKSYFVIMEDSLFFSKSRNHKFYTKACHKCKQKILFHSKENGFV